MPPEGLILRKAEIQDIARIKDIADNGLREEYSMDLLKFLFENHGEGLFVAETDSRIMGFILGVPLDSRTLRILMLVVIKEFRKMGIGSELLKACENHAKNRMMTAMILEVGTKNTEAVDFYSKKGFKVTGMLPKYYKDRSDAYVMKRYFAM